MKRRLLSRPTALGLLTLADIGYAIGFKTAAETYVRRVQAAEVLDRFDIIKEH